MANFSVQTTEEKLDSLEAALGAGGHSSSLELLVSVAISAGIGHELTYYGFDGIMGLLALGEINKMREMRKYLRHRKPTENIKGNANISWAANSAYRAILGKYLAQLDRMDSRSSSGLVRDFEYIQKETDIEPTQGIHDELLSKISGLDSAGEFLPFLVWKYIPYMKSIEDAVLPPHHVHKIYPALISENLKRSIVEVTRWYECTGILPEINGMSVLPDQYATQKVRELKCGPSGGQ